MRPIRKAKDLFKERDIEVHVIGDAKSPRNLLDCISETNEIGCSI